MSKLRILQFCLWGAAAFATAALAAYLLIARPLGTTALDVGGNFKLTSHHGTPLTDADLRGKPFAVFFGFTHCPDVCPTTLFEISNLMQKLGSDADGFVPLFITVDPERDTAEALSRYMTSFDPRMVALTGTAEDIAATIKAYRGYSRKVPTGNGSYTMDHLAIIYLMNRQGRLAGTLDLHEPEETRLAKLRRLIKGS